MMISEKKFRNVIKNVIKENGHVEEFGNVEQFMKELLFAMKAVGHEMRKSTFYALIDTNNQHA